MTTRKSVHSTLPHLRLRRTVKMVKSFLVVLVAFCFSVLKVAAIPDPKDAAHRIYVAVDAKIMAAEKMRQFGFLYLQRSSDADVYYTNDNVRAILGANAPANDELPSLYDQGPWPNLAPAEGPVHSNMRVAGPNAKEKEDPKTNVGHAEQKMLMEFVNMVEGVFGSDGDKLKECPAFIILGTKLFPCYKAEDVGCGQYFIETTKKVFDQCTSEATMDSFLYLYSRDNSDNDWHKQRDNFKQNGIKIIFGPQ